VSDKCSYSFGFYSTNIINFTGWYLDIETTLLSGINSS
jgi:hypothetical protein